MVVVVVVVAETIPRMTTRHVQQVVPVRLCIYIYRSVCIYEEEKTTNLEKRKTQRGILGASASAANQ